MYNYFVVFKNDKLSLKQRGIVTFALAVAKGYRVGEIHRGPLTGVREYLKMRMQGPEIIADIPLVKCCYEAMESLYPDREASGLGWFRFESLWPPNCPEGWDDCDDKREIKQADANAIYQAGGTVREGSAFALLSVGALAPSLHEQR
jgi:hypothetical protein